MNKLLILVALLVGATSPAWAQGSGGAPVQGEVLEVRSADDYTYLRLKTAGGEVWAAVTKASVNKGDRVSIAGPMVMHNFQSKALNQRFDKIVLGTLAPAGAAAPAAARAPVAPAAPAAPIKVAKASGADARTVAQVFDGRAALKDKPVTLRGQVVKVNRGIKGKNWIHLQDGSGSGSAGTNDIIVISGDDAQVGEVVTAKGTVRTDVKVGPGYEYAVLIDGGSLRK